MNLSKDKRYFGENEKQDKRKKRYLFEKGKQDVLLKNW